MKKVAISILILINLNLLFAKDDLVQKAMECYSNFSNHTINFKAKKVNNGYDIKLEPTYYLYKDIFDSNKSIHITVDEGPIVTNPHFTIAKAGLVASGTILDIFNKNVINGLSSIIKTTPKYNYEGVINFSNTLTSKVVVEPLTIKDEDTKIDTTKIDFKSSLNLDSCTGKSITKLDTFKVTITNGSAKLIAKGVDYLSNITEPPIDGYTIFGENSLNVDNLKIILKGAKNIDSNSTIAIRSSVTKLDDKHLKLDMNLNVKALDINTIALASGIKETKFSFELSGSQIDGIVELLKLNNKIEETQLNMQKAQLANDDISLQKAIFELNKLSLVDSVKVYNKIMVKDKTRLKLNLELNGDKSSFVKLDLIYKAKPVSGNMEGAIIELMAQNLAIADGNFEVKLDTQLVNNINPLYTLILDMLKTKGLVSVQNGVYHLKGDLKGGKIVINGKAYTLEELSTILF